MQAAAGLLPLLLIASILERRWLVLPHDLRDTATGRALLMVEAVAGWAQTILILAGEYIALASLQGPRVAHVDQHTVGWIIFLSAIPLLLPILATRAFAATPSSWSRSDRAQAAAGMAIAGLVIAWLLVKAIG